MRPLTLLTFLFGALSGCATTASLQPLEGMPAAPTEWVTPTPPEVSDATMTQSLALLEAAETSSFYGVTWPDTSEQDPIDRAGSVARTMESKSRSLTALAGTYHTVLEIGAWEPSLDALLGLGMVHLEMAAFVENAPPPSELRGRQLSRHQEALEARAAGHYADATEALNELVTRTGAYRWYGPQRRAALAMLRASSPAGYDVVPEEMPAPPAPDERPGRDDELDEGYAAWEAGDTVRAAQHFGSVIESAHWHYKPDPVSATNRRGYRMSLLDLAYARDANSREAALALGLLAHENDDPSLALDAFAAIPLRADATQEELLVKAVSWRADQDLAGARALYRMALEADPDDQLAAWNLSTLYADYQGDYERARAVLAPWSEEEEVRQRLDDLAWMESHGAKASSAIAARRAGEESMAALSTALTDYERAVKAARCPVNDGAMVAPELVLEQARVALDKRELDKSLDTLRRLIWFTMTVEELAPACLANQEGDIRPPR